MKTTELPPILEEKLAAFRKRVWIVKLTEGLLAAAFGLALSYALVFVLDRLMETPAWLRGAILIAGAAVLGLGLPLKWHRWVWSQRTLAAAAKLLRRKLPRLGDQLLGIVELARMEPGETGRSETLVRAAMAQAADAVKDQDFSRAVPHARHRQWAWAAGAAGALVLAAFVTVSEAARNALSRWLLPWSDTERYTFARVEKLPERLVVPYAEPFALPVKLTEDSSWKPESGKGRIQGQPAVSAKLDGSAYPLAFPPQKKDAAMALSVGDVRQSVRIEPRNRPELTSLVVRLKLPSYLQYHSEPEIAVRSGSVNVLKSALASFTATASRTLAEATLDGESQPVSGDKLSTGFQPVSASGEHKFEWRDIDGLTPRDPLLLKVNAMEDEAPRISARRETQEPVVLDSEVLSFDLNVADDFGIRRVGLEWNGVTGVAGDAKPVRGDKVAAAGEAEKTEMTARATFCAEREGVAPQTLEIRAWAEDYLPGRKRAHSATFVVHVLNKTDHALWLTEQFGKWLQYARESYEREQQLHATNRELRSLTAAELDRPENRRRVSQQAAAENANADRLGALTQAGRQLVEQATKNPEFDAPRLESWATMLKSLKDIAAQRMPGVTDLLKQTAGAQAGKPAGQQDPNAKQGGADKIAQNQNSSTRTPNGQSQESKSQQASAPQLSRGELPPGAPQAPLTDPNAPPKPPVPGISDREGGFGKPPEGEPQDPNAKPKPPGQGKLKLPTTQLAAAPGAKQKEKVGEEEPAESAAQEKMESAVKEQRDLLAEFAKVADQLGDILSSLEASTFVKRLKAASKHQMNIASELNAKTLSSFGLEQKDVQPAVADQAGSIAGHAKGQSEFVSLIQGDLEAYFQRKQDLRFKNVLDQMKKTEVVGALARTGENALVNLSGRSISASEYWADTLDRWAEEMVGASDCKACSASGGDSLPPEIVLMVMQALRDEMKLRDQTREMENARPALPKDAYREKTDPLARKQEKIAVHTQSAFDAILMLPEGGKKFGKELQLLEAVKHVMDEAGGILDTPETGPAAIAAETEAIELLLQAKRQSPNGGGGGGGNPGGGGGAAASAVAALSELGPGGNTDAERVNRNVGQSTGRAGREFPEEFKSGLDAYFNKLDAPGGAQP
jgi:hypothetical protein